MVDPVRFREQLQGFIPDTMAERRHRLRMLGLLEAGEVAFSRDHFDPGHFTASAFVLSPDGRRLLMILHGKLGRWLQPGGHVEVDDVDLAMAAMREVCEETGLHATQLRLTSDGIFDIDIHGIPARGDDPAHEHFDVRYLLRATSEEVRDTGEVDDVRWVPLAEVDALESDASVMRAVARVPRP